MAVISIERVESVMQFSPAVSIKEVVELNEYKFPMFTGKRFGVIMISYINGEYYRLFSSEYYLTLEKARIEMNVIIESWKDDSNRIILTNK